MLPQGAADNPRRRCQPSAALEQAGRCVLDGASTEEGKRAQEERLVIRKALKARDDGYAVVIHAEQTEELDLILVDVLHLRFKHSWEGRWKRLYILQISKTPEK